MIVLPTEPVFTMFTSLVDSQDDGPVRAALETVCDAIEAGTLPPEVLTEIIIGKRSLADALRDCADVMEDALADDVGEDAETVADVRRMIDDARTAAKVIDEDQS